MSNPRDWIAVEYTREVLADVRKRLREGAEGSGATLDADTCAKVLACLVDPAFPKGRPPETILDQASLALHCFKLEREGHGVEAAVRAVADARGCGISKVYAARAVVISSK